MPKYSIRTTAQMLSDRQHVGKNVRAAREAGRLNKPTLTARCYLAGYESLYEQSIGRVERGERDLSLGEAVALAAAIGCSLDDLARGLPVDAPLPLRHIEEHEHE